MDPEVRSGGAQVYPPERAFTVGIQLGFYLPHEGPDAVLGPAEPQFDDPELAAPGHVPVNYPVQDGESAARGRMMEVAESLIPSQLFTVNGWPTSPTSLPPEYITYDDHEAQVAYQSLPGAVRLEHANVITVSSAPRSDN